MSELPSSPSTASPLNSPRAGLETTAAAEAVQAQQQQQGETTSSKGGSSSSEGSSATKAPDNGSSGVSSLHCGLTRAEADAAVSALQRCLSICFYKVGGRATPLLNSHTLTDAAWIVSGAQNISIAQVASQTFSPRTFLAFACTEPWEVLLLLHAAAATTQVLTPLAGWVDVCGGALPPDRKATVRRLASRSHVYEQLAKQQQQQQHDAEVEGCSEQTAQVELPLWLTLIETRELQKGREFRAFVAGGFLVGGSFLKDALCLPR